MAVALQELEALVGKPFPGGTYTIEPYRHWLFTDASGIEPTSEGVAHPMEVYYGALAGMGMSVDDLFTLVHASAADGPMFGEAEIEVVKPLQIGATYSVSGGIVGVTRKEGRKAGVFDIVTFRLELRDADGALAAISTNSFIFPRRDA
jgi:acyl dehydratase